MDEREGPSVICGEKKIKNYKKNKNKSITFVDPSHRCKIVELLPKIKRKG